MGKVTDINKFKSSKRKANPETEGDYLCVILGKIKKVSPSYL